MQAWARDAVVGRELGGGLARGVVGIALQPVVRLADGVVIGQEALARFDGRVPTDRWFRGAGLLLTVGALALANGLALASLAQVDHAVIRSVTRDAALHVVGIVVGVAAVLWARTVWRSWCGRC